MTRTDRNHIMLLACFITLLITMPRLCAQSSQLSFKEAGELRKTFVEYGKKYIGCPYVSGATGPVSFDCSGFVYAVSRESIGYQIPRIVKNIYKFCTIIDESQREPGDLVFFKTTSSQEPSHIGIYIGNGQFLHCASDGPNTGVILSSLNENYWKTRYYKTGRFLPSSNSPEQTGVLASTEKTSSSSTNSSGSFMSKIVLEGIFSADWNFYTAENFRLNFRGLTASLAAIYNGKGMMPGIATMFRWDCGTNIIQIPITLTLSMTEFFKIFAGPVITVGTPVIPSSQLEEIKPSFFPGIIGICWNTPSFAVGKFNLSFAQDIHYTVFNSQDGTGLSPINSVVSGLVFSSGLRVTFPLSNLIK